MASAQKEKQTNHYRKSNAKNHTLSDFRAYIMRHLNDENDVFYTTNDYLLGNSANCQHTKIFFHISDSKSTSHTQLITHFLKFQIAPGSDDLVFESINGLVINTLQMPTFSKFIDLFPICVESVKENNKQMRKLDVEVAFDDNCQENTKIKVGIQESLENPMPLASIRAQDLNWSALSELFSNMMTLSRDYNFVHNDAHLENIQVVGDRYVLIDYGRSAINPLILRAQTKTNKTLEDTCQALYNKNNPARTIPATSFMKHYAKILNQNKFIQAQPINKYMIMYDISTITMNLIKTSFKYTLRIDGKDIITPSDHSLKPNKLIINLSNMEHFIESSEHHQHQHQEQILLPGLAVFIQYCLQINGIVSDVKNNSTGQVCEINLQKLIKYGYIWHYFQYLKIKPNAAQEELKYTYDHLANMLEQIKSSHKSIKVIEYKDPKLKASSNRKQTIRSAPSLKNIIEHELASSTITPNLDTKIGKGLLLLRAGTHNGNLKHDFVEWVMNCWTIFTGEIDNIINQSIPFMTKETAPIIQPQLEILDDLKKTESHGIIAKLQDYESGKSIFFQVKTKLEGMIDLIINACVDNKSTRPCIIPQSNIPPFVMDTSLTPSYMRISPTIPPYFMNTDQYDHTTLEYGGKSKKLNIKIGGLIPTQRKMAKSPSAVEDSSQNTTDLHRLLEVFYRDQDSDKKLDQRKHQALITKAKKVYAEYYLKEIASPPPRWVLQVMAHLDESYIMVRSNESITYL